MVHPPTHIHTIIYTKRGMTREIWMCHYITLHFVHQRTIYGHLFFIFRGMYPYKWLPWQYDVSDISLIDIFGMRMCRPIHRYQICPSEVKHVEIRTGCIKWPSALRVKTAEGSHVTTASSDSMWKSVF